MRHIYRLIMTKTRNVPWQTEIKVNEEKMRKVPEVFTTDIDLATCSPWDEIGHSMRTEELA